MIQTLSQHKLILIGIALLIAGGVWYGLSASAPSSPSLVTRPTSGAGSAAEQGIVPTLLTLRAVKLDGTILNEPTFTGLKDFSTAIVPEPIGRENPFAPLSFKTSVSTTTTKGTQTFTPRP